jgi:putative cell wall-binding protein
VGRTTAVLYNPNSGCGSTPVYIRNSATAALYYYTPYQPNAAALKAGYGIGDSCSSYGNRNFYNYFTDWFGSTQIPAKPCAQPPSAQIVAASGEYTVTVVLNGRAAPSTMCNSILELLSAGTIVTKLGEFGSWWKVRHDGVTMWVASEYLTATPAVAYRADRISGANRFETAAAVALQSQPNGAATVFLASGEQFPDALSGSALAARQDAAMLLVGSRSLPDATAAALKTLHPTRVIVLGGAAAVSDGVVSAVASTLASGVPIERVAGATRYETSRNIVAAGWDAAPTVYLASGGGFPDALSASSVAAAGGAPVLLADARKPALPPETMALLAALRTTRVVVVGGTAALSAAFDQQLTSAGIAVDRKGGADRWETSRLLIGSAFPGTSARVFVASGTNFPDALSGSVLAGETSAPLMISPTACIPSASKDFLIAHGTQRLTLVGGPSALSDGVIRSERC